MRYCHFITDPNNPEATVLLQKLEEELRSIGLALKPNNVLEHDETDKILMTKLKAIFAKYPKELSIS